MKRAVLGLIAGLLVLAGMTGHVSASTNDFRFTYMEADYYLGSDSEGRATLKTVEKLTAEFPNYDQNHGIERAIPKNYDGHTTSLHINSVTDGAGKNLSYSTSDENNNEILRIGDADTYVHGSNEYVITYTQRDVIGVFTDTNDNEFYWDTNGTQWGQAFGSVTARVHLSDSIAPTFTKKVACYQGVAGSTATCAISTDGNTITAAATNLKPHENMTVAVGFTLGTFRGYQPSLWDKVVGFWILSLIVTSIIGAGVIIWLTTRYSKISGRTKELKPIAVEYIPPDASVLLSAQIGDDMRAETTAQLIDLAVRHYITITQTHEKTFFKQAEYEIEIVKPGSDLSSEEKDFISALFGRNAVGTKLQTKTLKNNYTVTSRLQSNNQALAKLIKTPSYGLRKKDEHASSWYKRMGWILTIVSIVTWSPVVLVAAIVAFTCGWLLLPLTDTGLALRRYLAGLKVYIEVAEKDRIKMLQSPEGVEKVGVAVKDGSDKKLIKLYERVLPYAVLFGQEKEWNKQLALHYENTGTAPDWYVGHSVFNAAVFTSALSDFTSSMNSYGASSSSSSGGSGGGGSSGGGGGGGGGGGW